MSQSLSSLQGGIQLHVHLIFSTKNREPFLDNTEIRDEMHAFLGGIAKKLECPPIIVGGVEDHVHLLCSLGRTVSLADCVKELKRVSSIWIKQRAPALAAFAWQNGYGAFSVSASNVGDVREYIAKQEEHHRKRGFQDEYRALLRKHGLAWDERYVWE